MAVDLASFHNISYRSKTSFRPSPPRPLPASTHKPIARPRPLLARADEECISSASIKAVGHCLWNSCKRLHRTKGTRKQGLTSSQGHCPIWALETNCRAIVCPKRCWGMLCRAREKTLSAYRIDSSTNSERMACASRTVCVAETGWLMWSFCMVIQCSSR